MNIKYRENTLTADEYLTIESKMGDPMTSKEQAERSLSHQLFSVTAMHENEVVGIARLLGDNAIFYYINDKRPQDWEGAGMEIKLDSSSFFLFTFNNTL